MNADPLGHSRFPLVAGIVGGLGPYAHVDLEARLLRLTAERFGAAGDRDFPEWVVSSVPQTPDRTAALGAAAADPTPFLARSLRRLADAGADFAAIACNTAHAFLPAMAAAGLVPLPVVHVVVETARFIRRQWPAVKRVGLLATTGTCRTGMFERALAAVGIQAVCPSEGKQEDAVTTAVYGPLVGGVRAGGIKAGLIDRGNPTPRQMLHDAARRLLDEQQAQAVLVACSEISLAIRPGDLPAPVIDTMEVLAGAILDLASGRRDLASLASPADWPAS